MLFAEWAGPTGSSSRSLWAEMPAGGDTWVRQVHRLDIEYKDA
jgi:hypothetical protein